MTDVVRRQREAGIDVPGDGEYGKAMGHRVNYRAWWSYSFQRLGGLELGTQGLYDVPPTRSSPGNVVLTSFGDRRDRLRFAAAYADPESGITTGPRPPRWPVCVGPLTYTGHAAIRADVQHLKAALAAAGVEEGFMTSIAPGSASRIANRHYRTDEEFLFACADAMREEYRAIVDAGLILQLDDPAIAENWDMVNPEPTVEDYRRFSMVRVEALNHAIRGLPEDRIRFHLCWGSWHGPHTTDVPMRDIVDVMLAIKCRAYSFEAANVRHEHEWKVWHDVELPDGQDHPAGHREPRHQRRRASRSWWRSASRASRARSAGSGSSPPPTAASAGASTRRSRGPSSNRSLRARPWPRASSGARARRAPVARPPARSEPRTGGSSTMAKSKKASARVTAPNREQAAAADAAKSVTRGTAMKTARPSRRPASSSTRRAPRRSRRMFRRADSGSRPSATRGEPGGRRARLGRGQEPSKTMAVRAPEPAQSRIWGGLGGAVAPSPSPWPR